MSILDTFLNRAATYTRSFVRDNTTLHRWATVATLDPLKIVYDTEVNYADITPTPLSSILDGDRVRVATSNGISTMRAIDGGALYGPYPLAVTAPQVEVVGDGLEVVRRGPTAELSGRIKLLTTGWADSATWRPIATIAPRGLRPRRAFYFNGRGGGKDFQARLLPDGVLEIARHDGGQIDDQLPFHVTYYPALTGTVTNWNTYFGAPHVHGLDYTVTSRLGTVPQIAVQSFHGGNIEPGSTEIARAVADTLGASWFDVDGHHRGGASFYNFHISSNAVDDPRIINLTRRATTAISLHGALDASPNIDVPGTADGIPYTFIGGADDTGRDIVHRHLTAAGFNAVDDPDAYPALGGRAPTNAVNKTLTPTRGGVQIEMSSTQRKNFFTGDDHTRPNRGNTTPVFDQYVAALVAAVKEMTSKGQA